MTNKNYDFFVIGGGSGGVRAARIAAGHGAKVGIAESGRLGGTCVNVGCVPKKFMSYAASFGHMDELADSYGWHFEKHGFDWQRFVKTRDAEIERLNGIYRSLLDKAGADLYEGYAKFVSDREIAIGNETVTADHILIATGGRPRVPPDCEGCELMITSDDVFHLPALPKKMIVQGGGYIGLEFACIMNGLGVDVTLVHRGDMVLRGFDGDIRGFICEALHQQGIRLLLNTEITCVEKGTESNLLAHATCGEIPADVILSAIGRTPNTASLGLENAGIAMDAQGRVIVDDQYRSSAPHVYAVGDVSSKLELTPIAIAEGHRVADRLFSKESKPDIDYDIVPTAVFSFPPIGTAGLSEEDARAQGYEIDIYKTSFRPMKYAFMNAGEKILMKLVVDKKTDRVLGVHMAGLDAPEIIQSVGIALAAGATKTDFDRTIPVHPTSAEELVTMRAPVSCD